MARKSRKRKGAEALVNVAVAGAADGGEPMAFATAAYARLSTEKDTDDSIQTQVALLHGYIQRQPDMELAGTYVDNGHTGTDFDRPGFTRMMEDVRNGKIQCIVVKDLSRFGREFLETGYYIETILPRLNVRLVAVNDRFDSSREGDRDSIAVPIKNMINEMYAKDFSRKVTAYNDLHRQRGDMQIYRSVYGYTLDKKNNRLVVNPETAPYVRMVFRWTLMGIGKGEIVKRLKMLGVPTPYQYKCESEQGRELGRPDEWNTGRVADMLRRRTYTGDKIFGERRKTLYKNLPEHHTDPSEWTVRRDAHEPLVTREDFELVQGMLAGITSEKKRQSESMREKRERIPDCFPHMVKCMECGRTMNFGRNRDRFDITDFRDDGGFYECKRGTGGCGQRVKADYLKIIAMDQIQILIQSVCSRKALMEKVRDGTCDRGASVSVRGRVQRARTELEKAEEAGSTLYESFSGGLLDREEYQSLKDHYSLKKERLREELREARKQEQEMEREAQRFLELEKRLEGFLGERAFSLGLVQELVEGITVSASGAVEVRFRCQDAFEKAMEAEGWQ